MVRLKLTPMRLEWGLLVLMKWITMGLTKSQSRNQPPPPLVQSLPLPLVNKNLVIMVLDLVILGAGLGILVFQWMKMGSGWIKMNTIWVTIWVKMIQIWTKMVQIHLVLINPQSHHNPPLPPKSSNLDLGLVAMIWVGMWGNPNNNKTKMVRGVGLVALMGLGMMILINCPQHVQINPHSPHNHRVMNLRCHQRRVNLANNNFNTSNKNHNLNNHNNHNLNNYNNKILGLGLISLRQWPTLLPPIPKLTIPPLIKMILKCHQHKTSWHLRCHQHKINSILSNNHHHNNNNNHNNNKITIKMILDLTFPRCHQHNPNSLNNNNNNPNNPNQNNNHHHNHPHNQPLTPPPPHFPKPPSPMTFPTPWLLVLARSMIASTVWMIKLMGSWLHNIKITVTMAHMMINHPPQPPPLSPPPQHNPPTTFKMVKINPEMAKMVKTSTKMTKLWPNSKNKKQKRKRIIEKSSVPFATNSLVSIPIC